MTKRTKRPAPRPAKQPAEWLTGREREWLACNAGAGAVATGGTQPAAGRLPASEAPQASQTIPEALDKIAASIESLATALEFHATAVSGIG